MQINMDINTIGIILSIIGVGLTIIGFIRKKEIDKLRGQVKGIDRQITDVGKDLETNLLRIKGDIELLQKHTKLIEDSTQNIINLMYSSRVPPRPRQREFSVSNDIHAQSDPSTDN